MMYNIRNGTIGLQIPDFLSDDSSIVSNFQRLLVKNSHLKSFFDLENSGQAHRVGRSQWCHSMANINFYQSHT